MQAVAGADRVLFVVDPAGLVRTARLVREFDADHVLLNEITPRQLAEHRFVAVDVDLANHDNARALRAAMRGRRHGFFQAFAVDLHRRLETIYASICGATELATRPFTERDLRRRIALFEAARQSGRGAAIIHESIGSAADALGDMFGALTAGTEVEMPGVGVAGAEVMDAIADAGFPSWVDEVRRHHEGTFQHCLIVTGLASAFGRATGMSRHDTMTLTTAGLLHDIGKAVVPVEILDKPGKLTPEEMAILRGHPGRGFEHLRDTAALDAEVLSAVRHHHEYLDGSGYPDGLGGRQIGDITRILTICDVYGALIERRSYKPSMTHEAAMETLQQMTNEGKLERPLVRAFSQAVVA